MITPICTTLNAVRAHSPCVEGWVKLLAYLGKTGADDEPLPLTAILDSNGLDDALWALRATTGHERELRLYAVWCARQVQHLMTDPRSVAALDVAERFANGEATGAELKAAQDAARAAQDAAWVAARDAARDAAWACTAAAWACTPAAAAWTAAAAAAWTAARDAAWVASRAAALDAADAARDAARDAQAAEFRRVFGGQDAPKVQRGRQPCGA